MRATLVASLLFAYAIAEQRFLSDEVDESGFDLLCNPDNPEQCVRLPQDNDGELRLSENGNPMLGSSLGGGGLGGGSTIETQEFNLLCNPDDASECVRVPKDGGNNLGEDGRPLLGSNDLLGGDGLASKDDEDDSDIVQLFCNPRDPKECVKMPKEDRNDGMVGATANDGALGGGDYDILCNPKDPEQCVRVPKDKEDNGMIGDIELFCNPKDPKQCVKMPTKDRNDGMVGAVGVDYELMCNPANPKECVRLPKKDRDDGMVGDKDKSLHDSVKDMFGEEDGGFVSHSAVIGLATVAATQFLF